MTDEIHKIIENLVAIVDEELLPNAANIVIHNFERLNNTLIDARAILNE